MTDGIVSQFGVRVVNVQLQMSPREGTNFIIQGSFNEFQ